MAPLRNTSYCVGVNIDFHSVADFWTSYPSVRDFDMLDAFAGVAVESAVADATLVLVAHNNASRLLRN